MLRGWRLSRSWAVSLLREHFPLEQMNTKEKGIPSHSGHHLLLSWNNYTAWKPWKYDISFHFLLRNQQQSLTNLQPVSVCVLQHKCRKHRTLIRKSSLFQQHPRCTKYAGESKELTTQRSQRSQSYSLPIPALWNFLNATAKLCNCDHTS